MTSTLDLARSLAARYGVDVLEMIRPVVSYTAEIVDDPALWDEDAQELFDAGVEVVSGEIAVWQGEGPELY